MTADLRATDADPRAAVTITTLDPGDRAAVDGARGVVNTAGAHDTPDFPPVCQHRFEARLTVPWPGERTARWIARDRATAEVVGYLQIELPTLDNLDNAGVEIVVTPAHRRRGIGRALYEHAVAYARAENRRRFMAFTPAAPADGAAFARTVGMTNALDEVHRRLDLSTVDEATLDALLVDARAKSTGYSLVRWTGRAPDDCVADIALLDSQFVDEAPMGDLVWEAERVDTARVRGNEETRARYGSRQFATAARHDATGRVVALTAVVQAHCQREHADQGITLVHPEHRGHRLGMLTKIENLGYARQHLEDLRYIDTWNAGVNDHMIAINEAMGFRPSGTWHNWQQDI